MTKLEIDTDYLAAQLKALLAIDSPTGFTDTIVRHCTRELERLGMSVELTRRGAIRAVRQGFHDYSRGTVVEGRDPRGFKYYWFGLQAIEHTLDHGTDLEAISEGYASVTPLQLDLTHHASLGELGKRYG